ncbi:hypothetical protein CKM354_001299700 [Cercospora kikuchii]|uniref:CBM-cenC domain-containing protein n=1 Tax=Cercospora kikuchii TaxID=84275 RepID=A0A9P3FN40_9PEZI|nr:uncharacterized protein CKM354_001299700 [Cercospora kikuchii]GIZ49982.1 hypothetical protein CKM354_001299700 [Cercospora kikuchii]
MFSSLALGALLLIVQHVHGVAVPAQQTTCSGKYGTIAGALRHYAPAVSYCRKNHPQKECTTTITACKATSTITTLKDITVTAGDSTTIVTVSTTLTETAAAQTDTATGTDSQTVTAPTVTNTITATAFDTVTPEPVLVTVTTFTTEIDIDLVTNTVTVTETDTATVTATITPAAKAKRTVAAAVAEPTNDPTLDNLDALVARGDPRQKQWDKSLKSNPRQAIASICRCMVPAKTKTITVTSKGTVKTTTTSTKYQTITPVVTSTTTIVSGQTITPPAVTITATVTVTNIITPMPETLSATVTNTVTKVVETVTETDTITVTEPVTIATAITTVTTATITATVTETAQPAPPAPGVNVLKNPGFEDITASGPQGSMINWPNVGGGRVYPNRFQAAAQSGQTYAILHYNGASDNPTPIMAQTLTNLALDRPYTLKFYYDLHSLVQASSCNLVITLGNVVIYTRTLTVADDPQPYNWKGPESTTPTIPTSATEQLSFTYSCITTGTQQNTYSYIFFDTMSLTS